MRKITMMLLAVALLAACGGGAEQPAAPATDVKKPWNMFAAAVIAENYRRNPESAVDAGLHEYDGQMSDLSLDAIADQIAWLESTIDEAGSYDELEGIEAFERDYFRCHKKRRVRRPGKTSGMLRAPSRGVIWPPARRCVG